MEDTLAKLKKQKSLTALTAQKAQISDLIGGISNMALPVMEFQDQGYKIRKIFA